VEMIADDKSVAAQIAFHCDDIIIFVKLHALMQERSSQFT